MEQAVGPSACRGNLAGQLRLRVTVRVTVRATVRVTFTFTVRHTVGVAVRGTMLYHPYCVLFCSGTVVSFGLTAARSKLKQH